MIDIVCALRGPQYDKNQDGWGVVGGGGGGGGGDRMGGWTIRDVDAWLG